MAKEVVKKPGNESTKQILLILAKKIKIMSEQQMQLRILVDDLEDKVTELEQAVFDDNHIQFEPASDWDSGNSD